MIGEEINKSSEVNNEKTEAITVERDAWVSERSKEVTRWEIPNISFMTIELNEFDDPICKIIKVPNLKETTLFVEWFIKHCNNYKVAKFGIWNCLNSLFKLTSSSEAINNLLRYKTQEDYSNVAKTFLWIRCESIIFSRTMKTFPESLFLEREFQLLEIISRIANQMFESRENTWKKVREKLYSSENWILEEEKDFCEIILRHYT